MNSKENYEASFNEIANLEGQLNQLRASYDALNEQNSQNLEKYRALEEERDTLKQSVNFFFN